MSWRKHCSFYRGLRAGFLTGLLLILAPFLYLGPEGFSALLAAAEPALGQLRMLLDNNLQGSLLPFAAVLLFFGWQLYRLHLELDGEQPSLDSIHTREQLLDLSASLFFGIGVIWTAIGMRDAMLNGLGGAAIGNGASAFSMLQRLIEGGILTALSTTIVGSVGGYLMRLAKSLVLGPRLSSLYLRAGEEPLAANTETLRRIESLLQRREPGREEQA